MRCPHCSKEINDTAKVCGYCGQPVHTTPTTCPQCGKETRKGAKACGYCGHKFEVARKISKLATEESKPKKEKEPKPANADISETEELPRAAPPPTPEKKSKVSAPAPFPEKKPELETEPPIPIESTSAGASPTKEPEKAAEINPTPIKEKMPVWVWGIAAIIVVGVVVSIFLFRDQNLPEQVTEVIPDARVVSTEEFDSLPSPSYRSENVSLENGVAKIEGNGNFLENFVVFERSFSVGDGILALFKIEPEDDDSQWWLIQLYTENNSEYFGSLGFSEWYHPYIDIENEGTDYFFQGQRVPPRENTWYYVLFAITAKDRVMVRVWERDDPGRLSEYTYRLNDQLAGRTWHAGYLAHVGNLYLDSVSIISFK